MINSTYSQHVKSFLPEPVASKIEGMTPSKIHYFLYYQTEGSPEINVARLESCRVFPKAWKWYVKKNSESVASGRYGVNPNETFGKRCHEGVFSLLEKFRADKKPSFDEAYQELVDLRRDIAEKSQSINASDFSKLRDGGSGMSYTPITGEIGQYHKKCVDKFTAAIKGRTPETKFLINLPEGELGFKVYNLNSPEQAPAYVVTHSDESSGSEELAFFVSIIRTYVGKTRKSRTLNRIVFSPKGEKIGALNAFEKLENTYFVDILDQVNRGEKNKIESVICHCPGDGIAGISVVMDNLYKEILDAPENSCSLAILDKIARLHYLLANTMKTERGNAANSDMLITALLIYHGFCPTPYKEGISADMEALTSTENDFIDNYSTFRKTPFIASSD